MKIAFYIGDLGKGGAERVMVNLAEYFHQQSYPVVMVTKEKTVEEYELNPAIPRILADITQEELTKSRLRNLLRRILKLRKIWKREKPDVIVSFIGKNNFMALVSSFFLKITVIVSVRSAPAREYKGTLKRLLSHTLFRTADGIVLQTSEAFSFFPKAVQKKAVRLSNPLSPDFVRSPYKGERKKEIVTAGRIDDNKNQIMLVKAFARLTEEFPEWSCILYGYGDGYEKVAAYVKEKGLEEKVLLPGRTTGIADKICQSDIFVLPSKVEGMPNALMEAMVLGLAVISTDCPCGGPADLINQGENGILIPVDDEQALTEALRELLTKPEYKLKLQENGAKLIAQIHPDVVNREWEEYINRTAR